MSKESTKTFHCFGSLPSELRIEIWKHCFPPEPRDLLRELVGIHDNTWSFEPITALWDGRPDDDRRHKLAPNAVIAKVCQESRAILFETYTLCLEIKSSNVAYGKPCCWYRSSIWRPVASHLALEGQRAAYLYLDPKRDKIEFPDSELDFRLSYLDRRGGTRISFSVDNKYGKMESMKKQIVFRVRCFLDDHVTYTAQPPNRIRGPPRFSED